MCVFEIDELDFCDFPFGRAGGELDHDVVCFYIWVGRELVSAKRTKGGFFLPTIMNDVLRMQLRQSFQGTF